jgi:hypothetical protein
MKTRSAFIRVDWRASALPLPLQPIIRTSQGAPSQAGVSKAITQPGSHDDYLDIAQVTFVMLHRTIKEAFFAPLPATPASPKDWINEHCPWLAAGFHGKATCPSRRQHRLIPAARS